MISFLKMISVAAISFSTISIRAEMTCGLEKSVVRSSVIQSAQVCLDRNGFEISSKDCRISVACPLVKELLEKKRTKGIIYGGVGNPAYLLCHRLRGEPHQLEVSTKDGFVPISICRKGESFIDLNRLMGFYFTSN